MHREDSDLIYFEQRGGERYSFDPTLSSRANGVSMAISPVRASSKEIATSLSLLAMTGGGLKKVAAFEESPWP
jgi:hypothetical protein